jgi:hypothetical protein
MMACISECAVLRSRELVKLKDLHHSGPHF